MRCLSEASLFEDVSFRIPGFVSFLRASALKDDFPGTFFPVDALDVQVFVEAALAKRTLCGL